MNNFQQQVFSIVRQIPRGKVATYGQIAVLLGKPGACQAIGNALHSNTNGDIVPCHRVVNQKGQTASNYKFGGPDAQRKRLEKEGIAFTNNAINLSIFQWDPNLDNNQ
ncbi:MAG: MGMT family protein [Bacteroidales bacterium]|nr:MGMT family protein [Bacteroidales bacterium]